MKKPINMAHAMTYRLNQILYIKLLKIKDKLGSMIDFKLDKVYRSLIRSKITHNIGNNMEEHIQRELNEKNN